MAARRCTAPARCLAQLYLLFNEGYAASSGNDLLRHDLSDEAIRLARVLARLMPDEPEALGLLALMLLHHARRAAHTNSRPPSPPATPPRRSRPQPTGTGSPRSTPSSHGGQRMAPTVQADAEALAWTQSAPRKQLWAGVTVRTVVLVGTSAFPFFADAADCIVRALSNAERAEVVGADHGWQPADLAESIATHVHRAC